MGLILFFVFIVVPLLELAVIIQVGQSIGVGATIVALLGISLVGAALVKHEGFKAWQRFRQALAAGRVPTREVVDGALLLLGGALLLTPGFLTDGLGLLLLIPATRAGIRRLARRRFTVLGTTGASRRPGTRSSPSDASRTDPDVLEVEVIDVQRSPRREVPPAAEGD